MFATWESVGWKGQTYGDWRYLQADGSYASGWAYVPEHTLDRGDVFGWYYFDTNTHIMQRGWFQYNWQGTGLAWYYLYSRPAHDNGTISYYTSRWQNWYDGKAFTGWVQIDGYWYYFCTLEDCKAWGPKYHECMMLQNTWMDWNGKRYYFDASGHCTNP